MPPVRKFTAPLYVQVEPGVLDALDLLAELQGTTRSFEVRAAIRDRLSRSGTPDQLERDAAFVADLRDRAASDGGAA